MHSSIVCLMCLLPTILANDGVNNSSTDYTISPNIDPINTDFAIISTDITPISTAITPISRDITTISTDLSPIRTDTPPVENQTLRHNVTFDCAKQGEEVQYLEDYTTNITAFEEQFDRELYDTFNNLSTLLSEGTTTYDELTIKLLAKYSADANHFMITCKYIQFFSVCSEILKKSLTSYVIPQWQEHLDFGINILNNFRTYVNYSQGYLSKRNETVNQFIELYKTWRLRRELEKNIYKKLLKFGADWTLEEFMKILNMERKMIETISEIIDSINKLETIGAKDGVYSQTIPITLTDKMDIHKWNVSQNKWKKILSYHEALYERKSANESMNYFASKIHPIILGTLFAIGTIENVLLLLVFILNKEMRTPPNFAIINLTIADMFALTMNGILIFKINSVWTLGERVCELYNFCENFGITLGMYSVVLVSFERFLAVTNCCKWDISKIFLPKKLIPYVPIAIIWFISAVISSLTIVFGGVNTASKYHICSIIVAEEYKDVLMYSLIFGMGIVPLITIAVLSTITSYQMRRSIKNMPGEAEGLKKVIKARALSSRIILALTVALLVSHFPFFALLVYSTTYLYYHPLTPAHDFLIFFYIGSLTYDMKILSPCFNPIALYLMCRKYRVYMNKYIACGLSTRFSKPTRQQKE